MSELATARTAAGALQWVAMLPERLATDTRLRQQWRALLDRSDNLYGIYQSPEWYDHVLHTGREELLPALAFFDQRGDLEGLALPYRKPHLLPLQVRGYPLCQLRLRTIAFLGCEPLLPRSDAAYDDLLTAALAMMNHHSDGIYFHSVPTDGFLWDYLQGALPRKRRLSVYLPEKNRRFHALELPTSFEQYLATQFRKKKRYNLKREHRLLEEHAGGELSLRRIESERDAYWFAGAAQAVVGRSWQARWRIADSFRSLARPDWLTDLAHRHMLRSYVLLCAGRPCAMVLGYQHGGVFHYSETSYDQSFTRFSPGAVLLYLLIEDLLAHHSPRWINFGAGDSRYKQEFSNHSWSDAPVLLLRQNLRSNLIRATHSAFRGTIQWLKRHRPSGETRGHAHDPVTA